MSAGNRTQDAGWAAWWLDDGPAMSEARETAYGLYRSAGDARGPARMATWLATDQLDFHRARATNTSWRSPRKRGA